MQFADEAVDRAQRVDVPELLADCLDAALAAHWGPDDLPARMELAGQLDEVAAHVLDPDARLQAHLWGLQVACESLDIQAIHRHMRALERLGEESPRAQFFAASRRLMLDLVRGRTDTAVRLVELAVAASERAGLADAWMVIESMKGYAAVQAGDPATCAVVAAECEEFATAEGGPVTFEGRITFVDPEINPVSGQYRIWAELPNPDGRLRPGHRITLQLAPAPAPAPPPPSAQ